MKSRLLSLLLALMLLLGLTVQAMAVEGDPLAPVDDGQVDHEEMPDDDYEADADLTIDDLQTSQAGIDFIKEYESFTAVAYHDVSQMSIGYGCSTAYADKYGFSTTEITVEEADQLLLYVVAEIEQKLDAFLDTYNLNLAQHEYDALISFTFNVGSSWLKPEYRLANLLINGNYSTNEFASAMGVWCHVGTEINSGLIVRRIGEVKLFLYGAYALDDTPNKFCYLIYEGNGGSPESDFGLYLEDSAYGALMTAEHETASFTGWYTEDGEPVTADTLVQDDLTVYASWDGRLEIEGNETEMQQPDTSVDLTALFSDIPANAWYYDYVEDLYLSKVVDGYGNGTFKPESNVKTGEALKMILLAAGYDEPEPVASHWARGYLNLALDLGIIDRGDITDLDVPITREMMAKVAANALGLQASGDMSPFTDTSSVYVAALYEAGIVDGYGSGVFGPQKALSRAELCTIVWRMLK